MLEEANKENLLEYIDSNKNICVLVYTSLCGTCESAKVMLNIISETIKDVLYYKVNVNFNTTIIKDYNISSIPCFLIYKEGELIDQFYAFHSVTFLYDKIKQIMTF
jgi:thiol-disulfide isomerase/thioredoxin